MAETRRLTDEEAALVFRRATELERDAPNRPEGWDVAALIEVGREVGISPAAIRRAVEELQFGVVGAGAAPIELRVAGPVVVVERAVPGPPGAVRELLNVWLAEELFEAVRDRGPAAVFTRRRDPRARRAMAKDRHGQLRLRDVERVAINLHPGDGGVVLARLEAALGRSRRERFGRAVQGGIVPAGAVAVGVVAVAPVAWVVAVPAAAAGLGGLAWSRSGREHRGIEDDVALALEGALDRVERGSA